VREEIQLGLDVAKLNQNAVVVEMTFAAPLVMLDFCMGRQTCHLRRFELPASIWRLQVGSIIVRYGFKFTKTRAVGSKPSTTF
jgi:hypothetical protein